MKISYTTIGSCLLSLTLLILSAVALGSANAMKKGEIPSDKKIEDTQRSATGLVVISVILTAMCLMAVYGEYKIGSAKQAIYYF